MMDMDKMAASLAAAQNDVSKIFQGYEVPPEYRARLTAYIQRWYLDQGHCENGICLLRPVPDSGAAA
jgi:hypothetical protein